MIHIKQIEYKSIAVSLETCMTLNLNNIFKLILMLISILLLSTFFETWPLGGARNRRLLYLRPLMIKNIFMLILIVVGGYFYLIGYAL